jgi:hypothetical protein
MSKKAVLRTAQDIFVLDKAFFLIEGHPSREHADCTHGVLDSADGPLLPFTSENMGASIL